MNAQVWIVDFGSQYTQLITRKIRELGQESYIYTLDEVKELVEKQQAPKALVLSGGPQSVFEDKEDYTFLFNLNVPTLGVCYGMQLMTQYFGQYHGPSVLRHRASCVALPELI